MPRGAPYLYKDPDLTGFTAMHLHIKVFGTIEIQKDKKQPNAL